MSYEIEEVELVFDDLNERTGKTVAALKNEFQGMRAGRANPHILDKILVDYYGTPTPISQMANIAIPEARLLVINVWDISALKAVEKAIIAANVGIFPNNDGKCLRMVFPELNEERRKQLAKEIRVAAENSKIAVRNIRRDAIEALRSFKKDSVITEDDYDKFEKDVEKIVANSISEIDKITSVKEDEILNK